MPTGLDPTAQEEEEDGANRREAKDVTPAEAAFLAGIISSPSMYDPVENPRRSKQRRNLVLDRMLEQGLISRGEHADAVDDALPTESEIDPPKPDSDQPYFTSWLTQQLVDRYKAPAVFSGGLKITTTLDPELQASAEQAINGRLGGIGPSASLVAIENKTGEVKAMVGGTDFEKKPFNLATNGHRQPGSAFKPFILVRALQDGVSPEATFASQKKIFPVPNSKDEKFVVNNYEGSYSGIASLRAATSRSDNSVYAELGLKVKTRRVADLAQRMGIRTPVSDNPAMTLGGLKEGVTPLEMAFAYSTIANRGVKVSGSLASYEGGPVAIQKVDGAGKDDENEARRTRVFPAKVADTAQELLSGVVMGGTGKAAQIGEFAAGKTGTTENYGDAWFVGFNKELTVAVWVGYPDTLKYMKTEYRGGEVAGGTFPTEIWHDFMRSWIGIRERREAESGKQDDDDDENLPYAPAQPATPQTPSTGPAQPEGDSAEEDQPAQRQPSQPQGPAPTPEPAPTPVPPPAPAPTPPPGGGQGGGATPG
jgi:penicillin-binding protein 1A